MPSHYSALVGLAALFLALPSVILHVVDLNSPLHPNFVEPTGFNFFDVDPPGGRISKLVEESTDDVGHCESGLLDGMQKEDELQKYLGSCAVEVRLSPCWLTRAKNNNPHDFGCFYS